MSALSKSSTAMKQLERLMSMRFTLRRGCPFRFSVPDRSSTNLDDAGRDDGGLVMATGPVRAGALADQLGEPRAERSQRRTADREADVRHRQVTPAEQRLGPLDPACHQVAVGRLPEGSTKAAMKMARRHEGDAREGRNVKGIRVVAVHHVTGPAQPYQI